MAQIKKFGEGGNLGELAVGHRLLIHRHEEGLVDGKCRNLFNAEDGRLHVRDTQAPGTLPLSAGLGGDKIVHIAVLKMFQS